MNDQGFTSFHAHLYFDSSSLQHAEFLREQSGQLFNLELGRLHKKLVGPHPKWSCRLSVPREKFSQVILWLCANRNNVEVMVHPETDDDLWDHTQGVMWLGQSYPLNLEIFKKA